MPLFQTKFDELFIHFAFVTQKGGFVIFSANFILQGLNRRDGLAVMAVRFVDFPLTAANLAPAPVVAVGHGRPGILSNPLLGGGKVGGGLCHLPLRQRYLSQQHIALRATPGKSAVLKALARREGQFFGSIIGFEPKKDMAFVEIDHPLPNREACLCQQPPRLCQPFQRQFWLG